MSDYEFLTSFSIRTVRLKSTTKSKELEHKPEQRLTKLREIF